MFGRSPPNILATLILSLLVLIQFYSSPTQAKPHQRQDFLSTYTAGTNEGVYERDWQNIVYLKNSEEGEIQKRSPAEVEDQIFEVSQAKTLGVGAKKREGIETPIKALTSDSSLDLPRPNAEENVRSKVDQPSNESLGVEAEQENKAAGDGSPTQRSTGDNDTSSMSTQSESSVGHENDISSASAENLDYAKDKQTAMESDNASATQDKADSSKVSANSDLISENDKGQMEHKSELTSTVDENAQVRSVQESATTRNNIGNVPSDKSDTTEENQPRSGPSSTTKTQQQSQTTIIKTVDKQPESGVSKGTIAKSETSGLISSSEKQEVPTETGPSLKKSSATEEHKPINNNPNPPHTETTSAEPIRDTLGNSGSEIVTTHRRREPELDSEKDTWAKPANDPAGEPAGETSSETSSGPEVGHFQVDDKSADLEINANSAGVKVKAKPASLQVVSRPGSHSASGAQERSFFGHYHYPPFHVHHHWFPLMRRNYGHLHRRHFFNPYSPFAERRNFDSFYGEAPFYRRHLPYWYPHRHRHHFYDSYLYERSRLEEPDEFSRHRRRRHKRRFRHFSRPYRRQFYNNNIPIMNGMDAPPMGVAPEEGTMPQLPIGPVAPYTQRKNIVTPMPPPINVAGNPPPGILGGMNAAMFGMNGIDNLNEINSMNSAFNGLNPVGSFGFNTPQQMGSMGGLPSEITRPFGVIEGPQMALRTVRPFRPSNLPLGSSRKAFKKTSILSGKNNDTRLKDQLYNENSKLSHAFSDEKREKAHAYHALRKKEVNLKSWEKTLKHYHSLTKGRKGHKFRRSTKAASTGTEGAKIGKKDITKIHPQHAKEAKGKRKNEIVMHRPPIIYHPPPEIYHRPDIVVHRAPIMLHRPPIVYHQPPVVVHRPAIIYHQPPIVFHQPPPMVHQPILHSRDTWVTKPVVYHTASTVSHDRTYYGIPSHLFVGGYGEGCHGAHCSYRKGKVPHSNNTRVRNSTPPKKTKRDSLSDYTSYISSLWRPNRVVKRNVHDEYDFITSSDGAKQKLSYKDLSVYNMHKRDKTTENGSPPVKRDSDDSKNAPEKKKKKDVVVNRPPIIYHPPPEIYHRPDIVVHRPPLVIHRPPIIYHQPPVIVHRPAVVYHQPPIVFHQPPPAVSQPLLYSHDSFTVHPTFYATHHGSVVRDFGHYIGVPNVITNYGNPLFGRGPPMGKRSTTEVPPSNKNGTSLDERKHKRAKNESNEKAGKKNTVLVHRPPIIYHPPPEIYHRPIIVVHRPPIMIHRAPILYHQPPVVVHRPAIVYHQPPLIFHQPPPIVHQRVLKSHDTWVSHPVVFPYSSRVMHHHTYVGVPDAYTVHHYGHYGGHGFYKSHILKHSIHDEQHAFERNEITGERKHSKKQKKHSTRPKISSLENEKESNLRLKTKAAATQKGGKKNAVIVRRPPVIYHPPPEIYHRPEIVVHRAPIVIHRAPIIYHQPPVVVHRPAIVYHEPPLIFHQPPPVVHQPVYRSHDAYVGRPILRLYSSSMSHAGHLYHIPHAYYHGHGGAIHYMGYGKSKVPQTEYSHEEKANTRTTVNKSKKTHKRGHHTKRKHSQLTKSKDKTETGTKLHHNYKFQYHKAKDVTEKAHKKNSVVIHRPPIIYHPPPEIYHRPDIVVHRAPIVLYRAPIVYHQPPVVVHRPAIVYHQPPIVFHQPPPMVNQPVLHSHDTWVSKAVVVPYGSRVHHVATYRGVPHEDIFMHGIGTGAFGKSRVPIRGSRRNEIHGVSEKGSNAKPDETATTKQSKSRSDQGTNRLPIIQHETKHKRLKSADAATVMNKTLNNPLPAADHIKNQARPRTQRALENLISGNEKPVSGAVSITRDINNVPSDFVSAQMRMQRSINDLQGPMGGSARIQRVIAEQRNKFEGESPYQMFKRNSEESDDSSTSDENAGKNTNSTKKTILVIHRPPILYHPPSHMIHRPSIVVHRPDIIVHRHPIVLHRPPILVHRPPIIIHRRPILIHRAPIILHRPPLVIHRPSIVIHRRPYIIHHHPIMIHRAPIIVHKGPQMIIHHSHLIHHYPMHMIHMHCPGCGFGKSTVARLEAKRTHRENSYTSNSDRLHKESTIMDSQWKGSNLPKRSVAEMKSKGSSTEEIKRKKRKDKHKKKKDVVVNRPPIIYHPPPEVYHRPDIVVHRAPILIHRPPIVYHQPPVVVHRPAVVYHQPPIVFHQPAPAVNQPLLFSHDSFVVHPMAFASHMGSVVNDAGHYVGLPHGGVSNYPGTMPHGPTGHIFPSMNSPSWSRRAEVSKPQHKINEKVNHKKYHQQRKRSTQIRDDKNAKIAQKNTKFLKQKSKQRKGERKNKVIVARPAMIYHPPPEIYDRPDIIVHRPDVVIHQPSIVYHQSSVVVHRAPVIYHQPPVVFHQPTPMVSQPVYQAHDTYLAQHVYHPHESHISHSATYVGTPHYYPGHNSFGWGLPGNAPNAYVQAPEQIPRYGYAYGPTFPLLNRYAPFLPPRAYGRSKVENVKSKVKAKDAKSKQGQKNRRRRSATKGKHQLHYHHHPHQNHHSHHHHHDHQRIKDFNHLYPKKSFSLIGHRKHSIVINRPPMIYYPPPKVYHQPDIVMQQPALIYHRPTLVLQQPPTIVHHPDIVYHQPSVVLHNPQPIMQTPVIPAPALVKSHMEKTSTTRQISEKEKGTHGEEGVKSDERRDLSSPPQIKKRKNKNASKKQSVVAIHQPAIVYHSPPEIIQKPPIVVRQSPMVVHRQPILIHRPPLVVPSSPLIIRRPPVIIHQTDVPAGYPVQKSNLESPNIPKAKDQHSDKKQGKKKSSTKGARRSNTTRAERKNMVLVHRPAMIYHPPPEIYDRPDVIVHRPDIVIHRPSIVYHQPSVVVHRPPIIYRQPAVVFHQPPPMVHQPIIHSQDTYVAQPVPVPYTSHIHHAATYVGAPHSFNEPNFNEHAFGKSEVARVRNDFNSDVNRTSTLNATKSAEKNQSRVTPSEPSKDLTKSKSKSNSKGHYKANKKNQVIINRPPLIYHPPPEIYDRPDIIVHRPDIVVHRPSIVYHQPSVVVHRPPIVYQSPAVVFHQPPPLVNQPILHSHDMYVAHTVPVPHSSHIQHTSTYVGSPHYYPGSWNYGWNQPHSSGFIWGQPNPFGFAIGKSNIPSKETGKKYQIKRVSRKQNREKQKNGKRSGKNTKKTQVVVQRPPLIYHPPPEVYHKPDVIVHRPDVVIHRPAVVFHQPSVLIHRPPVIYHQPPVVFHQPAPMVSQPIMNSHDTYVAHPYFTPTWSNLYHAGNYEGTPHVYSSGWGEHGFGIANAFGKTKVEKSQKMLKNHEKKDISLSGARRTLEKETKAVDDQQNMKNMTTEVASEKKKNLVVMHRPPLIYHPPPEIYHKPDVIVHRPDLVIHRPSFVLHQPSVVVHRPPVIYRQPPIIFHQPPPMVQQPILQSHDTYVSNTHFVPLTSHVLHAGSYIGAPHYYHGGWGHSFRKTKVEKTTEKQAKIGRHRNKDAKDSGRKKRSLTGAKDSSEPKKQRNKKKDSKKGHKKNLVIIRRPPLVYHPPPEIYHKPVVVLHRPDIVIHRPSVIFHQPSVVVHRPSVIYRQPPLVFHQPPPTVHQPIFHSQETYVAQPHFVPYMSHLSHAGSYVGIPHFFPGHWRSGHLIGHAYGKSKIEKNRKKSPVKTNTASKKSETKSEDQKGQDGKVMQERKHAAQLHPQKENKKDHHTKIHRKNLVLVQRPTLIYHPPPEIYARPNIIVHRPDVVIHQASVVYHQPSVVVHRPPVIYNPPPVVFHQPPPMVNQPMYTSHDIYKGQLQFVPYASHIKHAQSYVGAPHYFPGGWNYGYGFSNSYIPRSVGFNHWSPMQQLYPHQANYLIPNTIATSSGTRKSSAFVKSDVQKYKDSKNDNLTTTKYDKKKSIHSDKKDRKRSRRSTHLAKILHKKVNKTGKGSKKNAVVIRRPPLVYHPPTEVYHKPDVIVHRPDVVIHQPSVVYHQPSVMVHRPPVIYNQPPVIFHQPSPMINQAIIHSRDHYIARPSFVPYASHVDHASSYLGAPDIFHEGASVYSTSFGKSNVVKHASESTKHRHKTESKSEILGGKHEKTTRVGDFHPQKEKEENASRKNDIVVSRPPIIYHPPPEIYHRPDIVVHRAPIVLHRPPIIYHQPPVVVHRPAVVYHQPPVVFHQPPPTVHQPILHSHDSFIVRPNAKFFPQGSTLTHSMSYVGIPNHVLHGDETIFPMFHRSHIEHSGKGKPLKKTLTRKNPVPKSTISKIPTTNKENTQTTITDQTQKKTLRSIIHQHKLRKRQLFGSHSLFGSVSPINNIGDSHKSVEQKNKLSTIPRHTSNRKKNTAKRQLVLPEPTESVLRNTLPSVYDILQMAALQNQALREPEDLQELSNANKVPFPGGSMERIAVRQYPFTFQNYLQSAPRHDSPEVRVHVETTKSSIPRDERRKRQIVPLYQTQYTGQIQPIALQAPNLPNLRETAHEFSPSPIDHLFSPYHPTYSPISGPYHYLDMNTGQNRPRVNINVQSVRSKIPDANHLIQKRSQGKNSKRQFLALLHPESPGFPIGLRAGVTSFPISPYSTQYRLPLQLLPPLDFSDESDSDETTFPAALSAIRGQSSNSYNPFNALQEEEKENYSPSINSIASYIKSLYRNYLGYPLYQHRHKPKVDIEVHASKSQIPKATGKTQGFKSHIAKRNLNSLSPNSELIANHHYLSTAYEPKRYQLNSLHVSRSVKTAKRHSVTAKFKQSRSSEAGKRKQIPRTRTGNKRDELLQDNDNERDISPFQGNSNMVATQENQFMSSSDSYPLQNELTAGNNEGIPTPLQQQENLETDDQEHSQPQEQQQDQQQDQQQITVQQPISLPDQRDVEPFQQQLAFPVPMAPIQLPIQSGFQPGFQPAVNLPLEPPIAPLQSVIPGTLPVISSTQAAGQTGAEEGSSARKWQPKHTTIDINVGAKSIVPQRSTKSKKSRKRKLIHSLPAKGKDNQKRAQVSLLTRIPAMQVLPQTFKQNGIMMPAFNTLPVNHRIKENGMLLEELQRQKKNQILVEKIKKEHMKPKENARKRQFFALQQSSLPVQVPFLNTLQVPQIKPNLNQPRVSVHIETAKKKTLKKQGIERNQNKAKQKRQIYGLSELPQEGLTQPLTLESRTQPLGYFPNSVHTPRVSINVVTSKRSRQDFQDIRKRQLLSYPSDVTGTLDEPVQSSQTTLLANELPQYNAVQSPNLVQASQSTEDEALQNVIQSNPSIQQQQQLTYLSSKEEGFNNRPKVIVHVEASKRDTKQKKKVHHAPVVHASKLSEKNEGADGYESPKKSKRQLFGTVPLFSSLDQTTLSGELGGVNSARSSVPISSNTQAKRIQKRQFYNYLGGQQEQVLSTQAMKDTNAVEQQQQDMPIQAFDQDSNVQTELPQMNLPQGSELPASNQYQGQIEGAESNQRMVSLDPLGAFHRPRVSINVQTTKSKVPYTLETEPNWSENKGTIYPQKETRKTKRQLEILGGGGILGRRRGTKLLTSPALKKGRGGNLLGLGSNLNKPVEVFADPMTNLLAGRLAGRKRPRLGGIRIPTAAGGVTLKDSVNQIEGPLIPGQGASAILQDNIAEEIAPFVQDSRTTESNPLVPPSAIAGPVLDPFGKGNTGDLPLPDTSVDRAEILPESTLNQAVNLPLEAAAAVSTPERQVLLTPQMLPGAPILPLAPPMLIPQAPPIQSLSAADQNVPDIRNTPPLRPVLPPIIPMPLPIAAAPPSPFTKSKGLFSDSIEDKPSVHVNVQTSRSNVPDAKHRSKGKTRGPPGRG